jgi:hypothetical protein
LASRKNGELLLLAEKDFDVFVTNDQNLAYQQNIQTFDIGIIVLAVKSNRLKNLLP